MDEFKIKINDYLEKFIENNTFGVMTLEKKYEYYVESDFFFQCTMFYKGNIKYVLEFYMGKAPWSIRCSFS